MARITVEDCLEYVENRFKLVLLASKRARQLTLGTEPLVEWENDKPTVVALREIADNLVNEEMMQESLATPQAEEETEFAEDDLAAALHAEISRELSQTVSETPTTTEPLKQPEEPPPVSTPPLFGERVETDVVSSTEVPEETPPSEDPISPPPINDSSDEGEHGF